MILVVINWEWQLSYRRNMWFRWQILFFCSHYIVWTGRSIISDKRRYKKNSVVFCHAGNQISELIKSDAPISPNVMHSSGSDQALFFLEHLVFRIFFLFENVVSNFRQNILVSFCRSAIESFKLNVALHEFTYTYTCRTKRQEFVQIRRKILTICLT